MLFLLLKPNSGHIITLLKNFPYFPFGYSKLFGYIRITFEAYKKCIFLISPTRDFYSVGIGWAPGISVLLCSPGDFEAGGTFLENYVGWRANTLVWNSEPQYTFLIVIFFYSSLSVFVATTLLLCIPHAFPQNGIA